VPSLQETVGARIRSLRKSKRWTQEDLGARSGLDFTTIGAAERGQTSLSLKSLARVAGALEVDLGWLVRQDETQTGRSESAELLEDLLGLLRQMGPRELRHVIDLVKAAQGYLQASDARTSGRGRGASAKSGT